MPFAGPASAKYGFVAFVADWPEFVVTMRDLETRLRRDGRPVAADILRAAVTRLHRKNEVTAERVAVYATELLRRSEHDTRVRPDTMGMGGPRLSDFLVAEPMPDQAWLPGSVGVLDEELLDNNVPWWVTNELGSSANVGRRLFGYFYGPNGDEQPPDAVFDREHPLFRPGPSPVSGVGVIAEPIPARHFVERVIPAIATEWRSQFAEGKLTFEGELTLVLRTME